MGEKKSVARGHALPIVISVSCRESSQNNDHSNELPQSSVRPAVTALMTMLLLHGNLASLETSKVIKDTDVKRNESNRQMIDDYRF